MSRCAWQPEAAMGDIRLEQLEPFPVDRDGADRPDGRRKVGCCEKFQESVSRWMLPEDSRSKYLERANCCPPPIFIILVSIAEVGDAHWVLGGEECSLHLAYVLSLLYSFAETEAERHQSHGGICLNPEISGRDC